MKKKKIISAFETAHIEQLSVKSFTAAASTLPSPRRPLVVPRRSAETTDIFLHSLTCVA